MPTMMLRGRHDADLRTVPVPAFGTRCVCCSRDARGLVRNVTPQSHRHVVRNGFDVPVCGDCQDHAVIDGARGAVPGILLGLGIPAVGLGIGYHAEGRNPFACEMAIAVGAGLIALAIAVLVVATRRERRERAREGHFPWLAIGVAPRTTEVRTTNPALVEELARLNPGAVFAPTRAERKRVPGARAIAAPPAAHDDQADAKVARVVACITKNTPDELATARAMLAAGEVNALLVEHRLAELEAVLGRRDLRARLRALSPP